MDKKMNIEVSLSRNFNKVTLCFLDENISYATKEGLKTKIREKFAFLRAEVERELEEKPQAETTTPTTSVEKASIKQKEFLKSLGYVQPNINDLTKTEASELIAKLKG